MHTSDIIFMMFLITSIDTIVHFTNLEYPVNEYASKISLSLVLNKPPVNETVIQVYNIDHYAKGKLYLYNIIVCIDVHMKKILYNLQVKVLTTILHNTVSPLVLIVPVHILMFA